MKTRGVFIKKATKIGKISKHLFDMYGLPSKDVFLLEQQGEHIDLKRKHFLRIYEKHFALILKKPDYCNYQTLVKYSKLELVKNVDGILLFLVVHTAKKGKKLWLWTSFEINEKKLNKLIAKDHLRNF